MKRKQEKVLLLRLLPPWDEIKTLELYNIKRNMNNSINYDGQIGEQLTTTRIIIWCISMFNLHLLKPKMQTKKWERERERERERDLKCAFIIERPIYAQKTAANFFVTCCILYKMGMITVWKMKCSICIYFHVIIFLFNIYAWQKNYYGFLLSAW